MFFTESAARGLIDVIDVIDHAWRPIDTPACMADRREAAAAPAQAARHVRGVDDDTRAAACHIARCCPSDSSC
jgi:hypothetical protein